MFAPPVAKPKTKPAPLQRSTVVAQRPSQSAIAQARLLQRCIGNQAMLLLLAQRASATGNESSAQEQELDAAHTASREAAPWGDFSKIPLFSPGRAGPYQIPPAFPTSRLPTQAKLVVGQINDPLEREADSIATQVMRMPAPEISVGMAQPQISRKCDVCEGNSLAVPSIARDGVRSAGQPLDGPTRAFFEPRFGHDFSRVRVHADMKAAEAAKAVHAKAYTVGEHVVFASGQYSPEGAAGRRLLAHELSHVVQRRAGVVQQAAAVSEPGDPSELQADRIAGAVTAARPLPEPRASADLSLASLFAARPGRVAEAGPVAVQRDVLSVPVGRVARVAERGLEFISKWGRNASPFKLAWTYFKLNRSGFADLSDVSARVKMVKQLRSRVSELETSARMLRKAVNEQWAAEAGLPPYPLDTDKTAGHMMVTADELAYVEKYADGAAAVANDAMAALAALNHAIEGWDDVVARAKSSSDFTREAAWEAVNELDLRFQSEGGSFRAFLVDSRDTASRIESWARLKQYHAANILGKWTPDNYRAPTPEDRKP